MSSINVSVVVLNRNGKHLLKECFDSIFTQNYGWFFEVILVDNASTDGSVEFMRKRYPQVKIMETGGDMGVAAGYNAGIRAATGEYIVLMNNDTKADVNWLNELVKAAEADQQVGICGSKIKFYGKNTINSIGHAIYRSGSTLDVGLFEDDKGQHDSPRFFPSVCGVATLYRKSMLNEIAIDHEFFDEDFYAYYEDVDLGIRAYQAGWKIQYVPTAIVEHKGSSTNSTKFKIYQTIRNRVWLLAKDIPLKDLLTNKYFVAINAIVELIYYPLTRKTGILTIPHAYLNAILGLPKMIKKRKQVQKIRKRNLEKHKEVQFYSGTGLRLLTRKRGGR
jgi:GT2 family glycosyltransferase